MMKKTFVAACAAAVTSASWTEGEDWMSYLGKKNQMGACLGCGLAMDGVRKILEKPFVHNGILKLASDICILSGQIGHRFEMCPAFVVQFGVPMFDVLENYILTKNRICNEHFGFCKHPVITKIDLEQTVDNILATKPLAIQNDDYVQNMYDEMAKSTVVRPTLRALHLSDVHIDFQYREGALVNCKEYLCCRADAGFPSHKGDIAAGKWGDTMCDIPVETFQSMLDHIVAEDLPDMIFWTGDNTPHDVQSNTADETVAYVVKVSEMIADAFDDKDVTVMPIHGNHDTWVEEIESFAGPNINYEINNFKQYWQKWMTEEAYEKYGEYGYYSMPVELLNGKTMPAGSRVIGYNTQACNSLNWYVWGQREDPGNMFAWLEEELLEIEAQGGIAFLIAHYTPNQCQHQFGARYRALMERFQNIVRFTMHGHTHTKYFEVYQSYSNPGTPFGFANVAGSVTTYTNQNPSYMMIDFDQETMLPVNMYSYAMDIDTANETGVPQWTLLHDYVDEYNLKDLSPNSMLELSKRFKTDSDLANQFTWNSHSRRNAKPTSVDQVALYCQTSSTEMHEQHDCDMNSGVKTTKLGVGFDIWSLQGFVDWLVNDWIEVSMT